jgi:hypothetical protein
VTPDDTELVADLRELSHRSLVAGRGGDRIESLSTQVEALTAERPILKARENKLYETEAALLAERAHSGEQDIRIAGLEVERDMARLGAANLIEQQNILRADLARERTAREQAEAEVERLTQWWKKLLEDVAAIPECEYGCAPRIERYMVKLEREGESQ